MFLHLYQNSEDDKEHLAIVFGNAIRSRSLDAVREGETEMDRLIRGAYRGRLWPGRTDSKVVGGGEGEGEGERDREMERDKERESEKQRKDPPLVRIHSECYTGETVWSTRCDCGEQLDEAARLMSHPTISGSSNSSSSSSSSSASAPGGVIIYLRQEGRGIGLGEKLKAYNLQDLGSDTVEANLLLRHPADARSYGLATAMLKDLGVGEVRLLTNNPEKVRAVEGPGREVVVRERVAMVPLAWRWTGGEGQGGGEDHDTANGDNTIADEMARGLGISSVNRKQGIRSPELGGYLRTKVRLPFFSSSFLLPRLLLLLLLLHLLLPSSSCCFFSAISIHCAFSS